MKRSVKVSSGIQKPKWHREYQRLLTQWMNNAAAMAQDEPDARFRHYLRAWYAAFEETFNAVGNGADIEIRVYSTSALPGVYDEDDLNEE